MAEKPDNCQIFVPGETAPLMRGGTPICSYETDKCRAILARDPQSLNLALRYLHALIVYPRKYEEAPVMYITAEQAHVTVEMLGDLSSAI